MKAVKFPSTGTVFDYYIDPESKKFEPWTKLVPNFEFNPDEPLQARISFHFKSRIKNSVAENRLIGSYSLFEGGHCRVYQSQPTIPDVDRINTSYSNPFDWQNKEYFFFRSFFDALLCVLSCQTSFTPYLLHAAFRVLSRSTRFALPWIFVTPFE